MLLLEQDNIRKEQVDDENETEIDVGNSREYEVRAIWDSAIYARKSKSDHLQSLYYLVSWKKYAEKENTWEPVSAM